ncbi:pilus assembly protein TadB [Vibrio coralliilyticus]|uniref:type II secretion system F family protein n=1 Tax=Vibrio coralliilyticus TaxID=190893 RepID=UPI00148D034F|nr:pilus assembly protein TadB [Vibrio coralliilyticus]
MILLAVVLSLILLALIFRQHRLQSQVQQRLLSFMPEVTAKSSDSIVKVSNQNNLLWQFLRRTDSLFSRRDRVLIGLFLIAGVIGSVLLLPQISWLWHLAIGLAVFTLSFVAVFTIRRKQQIEEFETNIVQVLGLVSRAVSAGLSVPQAIEQVANAQTGLMGREFNLISDNLALGISLRQTLDEACSRLPYRAFRYFSVAILLNESNGGQLREILHSLSRTLHDNRAMRKKVKSLTAEPRMTAKFLSLLPIVLLVIVAWIDRSMFDRLFHTDSGQSVLLYCAASISFGALVLHLMTTNRKFS